MKAFIFALLLLALTYVGNSHNTYDQLHRVLQKVEKYQYSTLQSKFSSQFQVPLATSKSGNLGSLDEQITQKLDSIILLSFNGLFFGNTTKDVYTYDSEFRNSFWKQFQGDETETGWEAIQSAEIFYNSSGQIDSIYSYILLDASDNSEPIGKLYLYRNSAGLIDSIVNFTISESNSMEVSEKEAYEYNESGQLIQVDTWIKEAEMYGDYAVNNTRMINDYNELGLNNTSSAYLIINGEVTLYTITENSFDENGRPDTTVILPQPVTGTNVAMVIAYAFNAEGDLGNVAYFEQSGTEKSKFYEAEYDYTYTTFNVSEVALPYTYGLNRELSTTESSGNKAILKQNTSHYFLFEEEWFSFLEESTFHYSNLITGVQDRNDLGISFYPNPASEAITLRWNNSADWLWLAIYNLNGTKVSEQKILSGQAISLAGLTQGVYLLKLEDDREIILTDKFIKN